MRILEGIKRVGVFFVVLIVVPAIVYGFAWYNEWQYVLQHQWITDSWRHYNWWDAFFAWDQYWAWLWYTNRIAWSMWILIPSIVVGFFIALILATG